MPVYLPHTEWLSKCCCLTTVCLCALCFIYLQENHKTFQVNIHKTSLCRLSWQSKHTTLLYVLTSCEFLRHFGKYPLQFYLMFSLDGSQSISYIALHYVWGSFQVGIVTWKGHNISLVTARSMTTMQGAANRCLAEGSSKGFTGQKMLGSHIVRKRLACTLSAFTLQAH